MPPHKYLPSKMVYPMLLVHLLIKNSNWSSIDPGYDINKNPLVLISVPNFLDLTVDRMVPLVEEFFFLVTSLFISSIWYCLPNNKIYLGDLITI